MKPGFFASLLALPLLLAGLTGCTAVQSRSVEAALEPPPASQFHSIVDVKFVMEHTGMPMPEDVMLIDARPYKPKYVNGHIPGAVTIPDSQFDKHTDLLPDDKNSLLIYYCGGPACKLSHKSAKKAEKLGYTNVKVFSGGYPGWKQVPGNYVSVSVDHVAKALERNDTVIVDARPKKNKFDKGHIPSALSIPFTYFKEFSGKLPRNLDTPLIFYCGGLTCKLSHKSAKAAIAMGYTHVKVFSRGYPEWKKNHGADPVVEIKPGEVEGSMDIELFKQTLAHRPESIMIVDVRDTDEFDRGSFKNSVHISVEELEERIKDLPREKPVVFVCSTGARSGEAYYMVQDLRPSLKNVYYLEAACTFKKDGSFEIKKTEG